MPTSTRFVVSVHTLVNLAAGDGAPMRSEDLAFSANTSPTVIRSLLVRLNEAGLTKSQLGSGGGALLARPAERITLLEVYLAVEDAELFSVHREKPCKDCLIGGNIIEAIQPILDKARHAMEQELGNATVAQLATDVARIGHFSLPLIL